jgi:hypothetical protein
MKRPSKEAKSWNAYIFPKKLAWLGRVEAKDHDEALKKGH